MSRNCAVRTTSEHVEITKKIDEEDTITTSVSDKTNRTRPDKEIENRRRPIPSGMGKKYAPLPISLRGRCENKEITTADEKVVGGEVQVPAKVKATAHNQTR